MSNLSSEVWDHINSQIKDKSLHEFIFERPVLAIYNMLSEFSKEAGKNFIIIEASNTPSEHT